MAHTIYCGNIAKKRNSTFVPLDSAFIKSYDVLLKTPTSIHTPTFTISDASFDYNYVKWGSRYYFVSDVVARNNSLWDVTCVCDVLATFKDDILNSTQFVSYSSYNSSIWLPDTRVPVKKSASVSSASGSLGSLFSAAGFYVLSVIGYSGCQLWCCTENDLLRLLNKINDWSDDLINDILAGQYPFGIGTLTYDWTTTENAIASLSQMNMLTGFAGNAYSSAPECVRSCIWVPFTEADYAGTAGQIYLGQFNTNITTDSCHSIPATGTGSVNIPWQFSDWRRATCEEIYLYLPLVGMVSLPSDEIINESSITVDWSATATDGCIAFKVNAGSQVIGTFGANCAVNYPIGVSQQASAGEIIQTAFAGVEKMVSTGVEAATSINPAAWAAGAVGIGFEGIATAYKTLDVALSRHNTCIGGIGGGAGVGLSNSLYCFSVAHDTVIAPADMKDTMGLPTMAPRQLSGLTGYCQCANAHVSASGAEAGELAEIDSFLNSGFFIEEATP